jgi:hypothetical protein
MNEDIEVKEKSNDGLAAKVRHLEEDVTYLKSKMQRISDNWKAYAKKFLGSSAIDGKLGFAKLGWLVMVAFLSLVVTAAMAETSTWYPFDTNVYGVVSIIGNSSTKKVAIVADSVSCVTTATSASVFTVTGTATSLNSQVNNALTVNSNALFKGTSTTITNSLVVSNSVTAGSVSTTGSGDVTSADKVIAGTQVTTYGYPAMASHTNGSAQVYITQVGTVASTGNDATLTATNTFAVTFIATPTVMWSYSTEGIPATNATTVASNAFTVAVCQTNGTYIAVGRIK